MRLTQVRLRLYARIGVALTVAAAVVGFVLYGLYGAAFGGCVAAIIWRWVVRPRLRRHQEAALANLHWTLEAE